MTLRASRFCVLVALAICAGCGGGAVRTTPPPPSSTGDPALARKAPANGEVLIRGELTPASHGPYSFKGRYKVSFEQFEPADPQLDFRAETAFVADLNRAAERPGPDSVALFSAASRAQKRTLELSGRYFVDTSFGDYPYVIRFTPVNRSPQRR